MAVDDDKSNEVEKEGDPAKADNIDCHRETQNACSTRTKTDDHGVVDAEDFDKPGLLGGEAVQENGEEADMEESSNQANTEDDDEYVEKIHVTESPDVKLLEVRRGEDGEGGQGHLPEYEGSGEPQATHHGEERGPEHQQPADDVAAGSEASGGGHHVRSAGAQGLHARPFSPLKRQRL